MFLWAVKVSFPSTSMDPLACFPPPPSGPALQFPLIQSASMGGSCSDKNKDVNALWALSGCHEPQKPREPQDSLSFGPALEHAPSGCPHPRTAHCKASWFCNLLPIFHVSSSTLLPSWFLWPQHNWIIISDIFLLDKMYWMIIFSIKHRT